MYMYTLIHIYIYICNFFASSLFWLLLLFSFLEGLSFFKIQLRWWPEFLKHHPGRFSCNSQIKKSRLKWRWGDDRNSLFTPPKFNSESPWKMVLGRRSFPIGFQFLFRGELLNLWMVCYFRAVSIWWYCFLNDHDSQIWWFCKDVSTCAESRNLTGVLGVKQVWHNDTSKWIAWIHNCWTLGLRSFETRHWTPSGNQNHNVNPRLKNLVEGLVSAPIDFVQLLAFYHENPWKIPIRKWNSWNNLPKGRRCPEHIPITHVWSKVQ